MGFPVTAIVLLTTSVPSALLTVRLAVNFPALAYMWLGFASVEVAPSPKFQVLPVALRYRSLNWTVSGASPLACGEIRYRKNFYQVCSNIDCS